MSDPNTPGLVDGLVAGLMGIVGWIVKKHESRISHLESTAMPRAESDARRAEMKKDTDARFEALIHSMDKQFESVKDLIRQSNQK